MPRKTGLVLSICFVTVTWPQTAFPAVLALDAVLEAFWLYDVITISPACPAAFEVPMTPGQVRKRSVVAAWVVPAQLKASAAPPSNAANRRIRRRSALYLIKE